MSGKEIVLGIVLFFAIGAGAGLIGLVISRTENRLDKGLKPRAWLTGIVVISGGFLIGYFVAELILILENKTD